MPRGEAAPQALGSTNADLGGLFAARGGGRRSPAVGRAPSDHFDGERFFNPGVDTDKRLADLLRWRRHRRPALWPKRLPLAAQPAPLAHAGPGEMLITCLGQASVLVQVPGCNILTDPIFSERASPVPFAGPKRVRDPGLGLDTLPPIGLVLLSHNHYDHMDLPSLARINDRWAPSVVTGLGNARLLRRLGLPRVLELDWGDTCEPVPGVEVAYVPAQHWSSRTFFDRRRALWGGHVIASTAGTLYFAGDTGYGPHLAAIGERYGPDVSLLPIGAYEPRWFMAAQHMNPDDAVKAHRDLGSRLSLAIHWGTFQLTDEALEAPLDALAVAKAAHGVPDAEFLAPEPGHRVRWERP